MAAILKCVSLVAPLQGRRHWTRIVFNPVNTDEDSTCSESRFAVRVKHTLQKKVSCLQQMSLMQPGQIRV